MIVGALFVWLGADPGRNVAVACSQPGSWSVAAAFDLTGNGLLSTSYPQLPPDSGIRSIPPSLLKAVGWVESGWRQYAARGHPLVSFDFGYGIMQVTSGMAGAFGNVGGTLDPQVQSAIASNYTYNIAYGARLLTEKWAATPQIGSGDPTIVEDWYYALWAYNGWGWVNNPNNPRFTRVGTPATNPATYPYQERVLYLVAHPPRDVDGNPLWDAVRVTLPSRVQIGNHPGPLRSPAQPHRQPPPALDSVYAPVNLKPAEPSSVQTIPVRVENTGTQPWAATGASQVQLTYHLLTPAANPWQALSPFATGVVAFGQGAAPIPQNMLPGQRATLRMVILAPAAPGTYQVVWDLEVGSGSWFSQLGILPRVQMLNVGSSNETPIPTPTPAVKRAPSSAEGLTYIADTSLPDGTDVPTRRMVVKGWLVYNSGQTAWSADWKLVLVSGRAFGNRIIPVPATHPCHTANIVVPLHAPARSGSFKSVWQLQDPRGQRLGDKLTVVVHVTGGTAGPTPTPGPTRTPPRATPTLPAATPTATPVG